MVDELAHATRCYGESGIRYEVQEDLTKMHLPLTNMMKTLPCLARFGACVSYSQPSGYISAAFRSHH